MPSKCTQKLTFAQFGNLLRRELEKGTIGPEVLAYIQAGVIPIRLIQKELRWSIKRSSEAGYLYLTRALG